MQLDDIWSTCIDTLKENPAIDDVIINSFLEPIKIANISNGVATILTDMEFNIPAIQEDKTQIEEALTSILHQPITIEIKSEEQYNELQVKEEIKENKANHLNKEMIFDNFVVGGCNKMAQNASYMVATKPGSFNPLFIYSNPGLGKTHLLNAIGNCAIKNNPDINVLYISSKDFVDEIVDSLRSRQADDLYDNYKNIDILLLDDIQFLINKEKSSEMFFHIFNELINNGKQIVITSDKTPDELNGIEDRLISRFKSGLSFGIDPPEFETAKAILYKKLKYQDNFSSDSSELIIDESVIDYMATNYCTDVRNLEGHLNTLFFCAIMECKNHVDLDFALGAFQNDNGINNGVEITPESILKIVADTYFLQVRELTSKTKTATLLVPRELCMYLIRQKTDTTYADIGKLFSNRDHSTIMKACSRVQKRISKEVQYKKAYEELKKKIG
ncbi:MAG: chromosomal replication initiator protein DnaA [Thomasclavelia sp.]|nr:chromosomal replication initiator protein DnaA [Thomasclavelia sp.]